jgi:hypothetical protein
MNTDYWGWSRITMDSHRRTKDNNIETMDSNEGRKVEITETEEGQQ